MCVCVCVFVCVILVSVFLLCVEQAEQEARAGLETAPHMQLLSSAYDVAKLQIDFFDFVVAPLWAAAAEAFPEAKDRLPHLEANRARYLYISFV